MSDHIKPTSYPEAAAFHLIIELIRSDKVPMVSDNVTNILKIYDQAVSHFKESRNKDRDD
ncbi:ATP-NAD kinase [Citrobacter amalonaticus]|uniref:ATP-NAD kinase n=1 Tax=Citrobacter amalonaticus TaxID=35703 RepID=A0ABY0I1I6_CITAM|nr:ATP-NAD kinase [Citrobacter amalonaticus]